ncbi:MAG: Omp28-related outer membrane protein [Saprospirales bacterium]|nr:Omp28-related outer membrane protein [Saprospirales bacterium]
MQKNAFFIVAALVSLLLPGCEEEPVTIPELNVGKRNVLVEELTGVRCPNCPDGTAALVSLDEQFGANLVVVSVHAAQGYDLPYPESKYDFRTAKGSEMAAFIGDASFFPTASINRRLVPPETEPYLPRSIWAGIIAEELGADPLVGVFLSTEFDPVSRQLEVTVNLAPETNLSGEHRLTVMLTQDSIQDYQKVNLDKVPDYYHRHVLRDILTQATGDVINEALTPNAAITRTFTATLPADWKEEHCSVVAFVHYGTTPNKEVLQVAEKHVGK